MTLQELKALCERAVGENALDFVELRLQFQRKAVTALPELIRRLEIAEEALDRTLNCNLHAEEARGVCIALDKIRKDLP